jgi:hypothetical protein
MASWNAKIDGNDTFLDIYQNFYDLYNQGENPKIVSEQIQTDFAEMFADYDDRNNSLFGLILAQWETKTIDPEIFTQVKEIIERGNDLKVWEELGANEEIINERKIELERFLKQISTEKEKPKRRVKPKFDFKEVEIFSVVSPENKKMFRASEHYVNGIYEQTGSLLNWKTGGTSIFYFTGQGLFINAKWLNESTIEVAHDKNITFTKKDEKFFHFGDEGIVIYKPK